MRRSTFVLMALGSLAVAQPTFAQDPVKLSPKLYTVLLENDQVRVLEYHSKPGDKEPMHSHPSGVVYALTDVGKAKGTARDGKVENYEPLKAGTALWIDPVTHTWENMGTG